MDPFIGEIKQTAFPFAPRGWFFCDGRLLPIALYQALFSLLGTNYGGNGQTTFALPDLRGRMPMHPDNNRVGDRGGAYTHTLTVAEMPAHNHTLMASGTPSHSADPTGKVLGATEAGGLNILRNADGSAALHPAALSNSGGGQPHENMQPFLVCNFIIAYEGIYPPRQ